MPLGWDAKHTALNVVTLTVVRAASEQVSNKVHAVGVLAAPG